MLRFLIVNVGSTSLKFKLISFQPPDLTKPKSIPAQGRLEGIGQPRSIFRMMIGREDKRGQTTLEDYDQALKLVLDALGPLGDLAGVGFKPVHARDVDLDAVEMTEDVLERMADFDAVTPAHNPPVIRAVRSFRRTIPNVPLIGLFEPAFHQDIAPHVAALSVPAEWEKDYGIRKYGFHGASHRFVAERASQFLDKAASELRIVSCHLGGSSSICAIRDGRSVDTTMEFSPQSGLPQGARCGSIDPFILIYLMKEKGWTVDQLAESLSKKSGLLGISGVSAEFREIEEAARRGNDRARLAIDHFAYRVQGEIARMTVPLEGLDTLVFTGGIGERGASFRASVCEGLRHLGVRIDFAQNASAIGFEASVHVEGSRVRILVLPTDEELIIAREAARFVTRRG